MRLVFMGSPEFAVPTLKRLIQDHQLAAVVCQPDRPAGRGRKTRPPAVKRLAAADGIPVLQPQRVRDPEAIAAIAALEPEIIVVAAYGQILPQALLDIPPRGCLNVHASLLPRWRGAAPIQAALLNDDPETGITIMLMDAGMDTGPILAQRPLAVPSEVTAGALSESLAELGAELLAEVIPAYSAGQIEPRPQDDSLATLAPSLSKADGELEFGRPAVRLARQVRAFEPWPGSFTHWQQARLVVRRAHAARGSGLDPGSVHSIGGLPAVATSEGDLLLDRLQLAGRKELSGSEFVNGAPGFLGARLPS